MSRPPWWWSGAVLLVGCAYRVPVFLVPPAGTISMDDEVMASSAEVRVAPFRPQKLTLEAPGRRTMAVTIRWNALQVLKRSRSREFRLVEEHGASGTWTR